MADMIAELTRYTFFLSIYGMTVGTLVSVPFAFALKKPWLPLVVFMVFDVALIASILIGITAETWEATWG